MLQLGAYWKKTCSSTWCVLEGQGKYPETYHFAQLPGVLQCVGQKGGYFKDPEVLARPDAGPMNVGSFWLQPSKAVRTPLGDHFTC